MLPPRDLRAPCYLCVPYTWSCTNTPDRVPNNKGDAGHHHQPDSQFRGLLPDQSNSRMQATSLQLQGTPDKAPILGRAAHIALLPVLVALVLQNKAAQTLQATGRDQGVDGLVPSPCFLT